VDKRRCRIWIIFMKLRKATSMPSCSGGFCQDHNRLKDRKDVWPGLSGFEKARGPEQSSILPTVNNLGCATVL
jgi:hypothetical protein